MLANQSHRISQCREVARHKLQRPLRQLSQRLSGQTHALKARAGKQALFDGSARAHKHAAATGVSLAQLFRDRDARREMTSGAATREEKGLAQGNS